MTRIFVYGTLKRGFCRAHALRDQRFLGLARTAPRYRLYDVGDYPAMVDDQVGVSVEGELWEVDEEGLRAIDTIEGVPAWFQRKPVVLEHPADTGAEAYFYCQSVANLADCGSRWK